MRTMRMMAVWAMVCCLCSAGLAQEAKTSDILKQIPSGNIGFLAVNSVKGSTSDVDKFLADVGLNQMLKAQMPDGLLALMKKNLNLGEGFNPDNGFAAVVMDMGTDYDWSAAMKADKPDCIDCMVIIVPGKDLDSTFTNLKDAKKETVGKFVKTTFAGGERYTFVKGGYIYICTSDKTLQTVLDAKGTAASEVSKDASAVLGRSDIGVFVNLKAGAPIMKAFMEKAAAEAKGPQADMAKQILKSVQEAMEQVSAVTFAARTGKTGLVLEEFVEYLPESKLGKGMAALKGGDVKSLLGKLPNNSPVLAFGSVKPPTMTDEATIKNCVAGFEKAIAAATRGTVDAKMGEKLGKLMTDFNGQVTGIQFVLGQAPADSGLFGMAVVMNCADAEKVKGLLEQSADFSKDLIKVFAEKEKDIADLEVKYTKDAAKEGKLSIDTLEFTHPELANMPEDVKPMMKSFLGEEQVRLMVTAPDAKTVVVTFGGSTKFMAEAAKAAKSGGTMPADKGLAQVMPEMPKNLVMIGTLNGANLMDMITKGMAASGQMIPLPFKLTATVPATIGIGTTGANEHVVIFLPNELIKDVSGMFMMMSMGRNGPRPSPSPTTEEF